MRKAIQTDLAPAPVGSYSQAVLAGNTIYLAGQIALDPRTSQMIQNDLRAEAVQVFENIKAIAESAGGNMSQIVKLTVYLMDLASITVINDVIPLYFSQPYPARTSIQVAGLPKSANIEIDAIMLKK